MKQDNRIDKKSDCPDANLYIRRVGQIAMGDIHGEWHRFNLIVDSIKPSIILQTGDFGYWPSMDKHSLSHIKLPRGTKLYWADGNHEDHWRLNEVKHDKKGLAEVAKNIFHVKRGSVINLNGYKIMFVGGAESFDKHLRKIGYDWFPEESISNKDMETIMAYDGKVDIVVSHTAPGFVADEMNVRFWTDAHRTSTETALEQVFEKFRPIQWFYGHFHIRKMKVIQGCRFDCLNMIDYVDDCCVEIDIKER